MKKPVGLMALVAKQKKIIRQLRAENALLIRSVKDVKRSLEHWEGVIDQRVQEERGEWIVRNDALRNEMYMLNDYLAQKNAIIAGMKPKAKVISLKKVA